LVAVLDGQDVVADVQDHLAVTEFDVVRVLALAISTSRLLCCPSRFRCLRDLHEPVALLDGEPSHRLLHLLGAVVLDMIVWSCRTCRSSSFSTNPVEVLLGVKIDVFGVLFILKAEFVEVRGAAPFGSCAS